MTISDPSRPPQNETQSVGGALRARSPIAWRRPAVGVDRAPIVWKTPSTILDRFRFPPQHPGLPRALLAFHPGISALPPCTPSHTRQVTCAAQRAPTRLIIRSRRGQRRPRASEKSELPPPAPAHRPLRPCSCLPSNVSVCPLYLPPRAGIQTESPSSARRTTALISHPSTSASTSFPWI